MDTTAISMWATKQIWEFLDCGPDAAAEGCSLGYQGVEFKDISGSNVFKCHFPSGCPGMGFLLYPWSPVPVN